MKRPVKLFCYKLGRDLHMDIDLIMSWPLCKIYEYMAFYITETDEWKEKMYNESLTADQRNAIAFAAISAAAPA